MVFIKKRLSCISVIWHATMHAAFAGTLCGPQRQAESPIQPTNGWRRSATRLAQVWMGVVQELKYAAQVDCSFHRVLNRSRGISYTTGILVSNRLDGRYGMPYRLLWFDYRLQYLLRSVSVRRTIIEICTMNICKITICVCMQLSA